ncbi:MAG: caspase family protein, partial [Hyphomicrobiaceae bacterium]|nr:caspase family protein [Hyphomicrobiaceae bacterium]
AAADKKAAEAQQAALEKKAAADKKAAEAQQAARAKKAAADKKAAEERQAALDKKAAAEKAEEERRAALRRKAELELLQPPTDAPRRSDRMALVIGNAAYDPSLGKLENPANDARDVARTLRRLGFSVWLSLDLGHVAMKDALASFAAAAHEATTALVFFSGHGFQHGSVNYLAPVDAPITDDDSIANHVSLDWVMAGLKAQRGARILIVDACRNNLAVEQAAGAQVPTRQVAVTRGLSPVTIASTWAGGGMLVAFATLPGDVASDGAGRNSPFTHALVKHLPTPNLELRHLFVRVRAEVIAATLGRQIPQVSDALNGEYVFRTGR